MKSIYQEENKMKKKRVLALMLAGAMMLGLAACGSSGGDSSGGDAAADDNKLTIWAWDEAFNIKAANVAADMYKETNSDVEIEVVTMAQDDIVAKLNTSLSSGSYDGLPDIVLIEDYRIQGYLNAYEDEFADLSDIASPDDFAEYKTGVNQKDGKMYGIPFDSGVAAVFYRTDYIEQAGYTAEDMQDLTWDKYIEIGKAVKEKSGKWAVAPFPRMAQNADSVNASSIGGGGWYVLKNVGHEDLAKDFLKETFASNVDLMNQLATDINLVSTLKASSEAENYSKGVDFYDMMTEALQAILGGADVQETLDQYQTQIESAVAN